MLSEPLSAACCGISTNTVQGTAGTTEGMIKYSWNYAMLLSKGPCREALVPAPLLIGMEKGIFARFEEITRTPAEIQDSLISIMSEQIYLYKISYSKCTPTALSHEMTKQKRSCGRRHSCKRKPYGSAYQRST